MSEDDKDFYRARFKKENLKRERFGEEEIPIPEELMGEEDEDYNLELSERNESREKESEKDEDEISDEEIERIMNGGEK